MDALILSCSTGGGHNAAGYAVKEELERRGHHVTMLDPYSLAGKNLDKRVADGYVKIVQRSPRMFGMIYGLGNWYRTLPVTSPVYQLNRLMGKTMQSYLASHPYDIILMPHLYPGEILTHIKRQGGVVPKTIFIATDYVCIPFTEEIDCDYYVTPSEALNEDFIRRGIPKEKLVPAGIPVRHAFEENISRETAKAQLNLDADKRYLLLSGGSIGAGQMRDAIAILMRYLSHRPDMHLIVICGNNTDLLTTLQKKYGNSSQMTLLSTTDQMALYMKACEAFLSKPGGLSSTEAAVANAFLLQVSPIPGCENCNVTFFAQHGMSIPIGDDMQKLIPALEKLEDADFLAQMAENQRRYVPAGAAERICDLAERITQ